MKMRYGYYLNGRNGVEVHEVDGGIERAKEAVLEMAKSLAGTYAQDGYVSHTDVREDGVVHIEVVRPGRRHCSHCGAEMTEGFCIDDGAKYFCSDECLHTEFSEEEYEEAYDEGWAYYTEWGEKDPEDWFNVSIEPVEIIEDGVAPID